ncbi:MAG: hypothetical protein AAAC48_08225 [Phyllobacterium sp.]|uniref:hypothetical protein n=1 Tax=Phyllobacterium sp. TaxID=1871046 RepID=UPI0030F1CA85
MKKLLVAGGLLALLLAPSWSQEPSQPKPIISEEMVRIISAKAYSKLLLQAYEKGWRYPRSQIEKGFKRHFEELKLQLVAQGYAIISQDAEEDLNARPLPRDL